MAQIARIKALAQLRWSHRKIARELGIHRETVSRHLKEADSKPANSTPGKDAAGESKPANSTSGKAGRPSDCEPYRERIEQKLEAGCSAQVIFQDLRDQGVSYQSVKRFVRRLKHAQPQRVWRLESLPAEEAQIDLGKGAVIVDEQGKRRHPWVLRVSLSYSRKAYSEAIYHQNTESVIRCLENAFRHFGGVPQTLCPDNLKAAVIQADWHEPALNPKFEGFCRHYGTVCLPARPYRPQDKGKIESGIKYVKNNALKGRAFSSLKSLNTHLLEWETQVADRRIHGTTRQQVARQFLEHEQGALSPLPPDLFPCFQEAQRSVHRDSYVEVARSYYQVPEEYINRKVWVRWDNKEVRIFNQRMEQIQMHARLEPGKFSSTLGTAGHRQSVQESLRYWQRRAAELGSPCGQWAQELARQRGAQAIRVFQGLCGLISKHSLQSINQACSMARLHGAWRLKDIRRLLDQPKVPQQTFSFMQTHPLIRDLSQYGELLQSLQTQEHPHE